MNTKGKALHTIINMHRNDELNFEPSYQRAAVWKKSQKQLLIDSLFIGYDIPKIYLHAREDENGKYVYDVVDGQQRLRTIIEFANDEFSLGKDNDTNIKQKKYSQLDTTQQDDFQAISIDICYLEAGFSDDDIEDMFLRLQDGTPLNAAEKRRALSSQTQMTTVVKELADHKVFPQCMEATNKRYGYEDAVAKVLTLMLSDTDFVSIGTARIKRTYLENNQIKTSTKQCVSLKKAYTAIYTSFKKIDLEPKLKKWAMISLPIVVNELLEKYAFSDQVNEIARIFMDLEERRKANDQKDEDEQDTALLELTNCLRADSPESMRSRHQILMRKFLNKLPTLEAKDRQRNFTQDQRLTIYFRTSPDYICQAKDCDTRLSQNEFEADHIKPWSKAGKTTVKNGQALCIPCNRKKSDT